jgi:ribonuclease III
MTLIIKIFRRVFPRPRSDNLRALEKKIGYCFIKPELGERALRHRSIIQQQNLNPKDAYERLEFLGDAVLGFVVARYLMRTKPEAEEGDLTKDKSLIVSGEVLSQSAEELGLGDHLILGNSELKTGGRSRPSILEDIFESIVGAIYLDGGLKNASKFIHRHLLSKRDKIFANDDNKNYKSILLEYSQAKFAMQPQYKVIKERGPDHKKIYVVEVLIDGQKLGQGEGLSKKRAEQRAAQEALKDIDEDIDSIYNY